MDSCIDYQEQSLEDRVDTTLYVLLGDYFMNYTRQSGINFLSNNTEQLRVLNQYRDRAQGFLFPQILDSMQGASSVESSLVSMVKEKIREHVRENELKSFLEALRVSGTTQ